MRPEGSQGSSAELSVGASVFRRLNVWRTACVQQQHGYLQQSRRRMIIQSWTTAAELVRARRTYQAVGNITSACVPAIRAARGPPETSAVHQKRRGGNDVKLKPTLKLEGHTMTRMLLAETLLQKKMVEARISGK